jgi:hypothetical protein
VPTGNIPIDEPPRWTISNTFVKLVDTKDTTELFDPPLLGASSAPPELQSLCFFQPQSEAADVARPSSPEEHELTPKEHVDAPPLGSMQDGLNREEQLIEPPPEESLQCVPTGNIPIYEPPRCEYPMPSLSSSSEEQRMDTPAQGSLQGRLPTIWVPLSSYAMMAPISLSTLQGLCRFMPAQSEYQRSPGDDSANGRGEEEKVPTGCDHALERAKDAVKQGCKNRKSSPCLSFPCFDEAVRILQEWKPDFTKPDLLELLRTLLEEMRKTYVAANVYCTHDLVKLIEQGPLFTDFGEVHSTLANHSHVDLLQLYSKNVLEVEPSNEKARIRWSWASLKKELEKEECDGDVIRQAGKYLEGEFEIKKNRQGEECSTQIDYGMDYELRIKKALRRDVEATDTVTSAQHSTHTVEDLRKLSAYALRKLFPLRVKTPLNDVVDYESTCKMLELAKTSLATSLEVPQRASQYQQTH